MFTRINAVLVGVLLLLGLAVPFAHAAEPTVGVTDRYNAAMCGNNDWERIKTPVTEFVVSDSAGTCVSAGRYDAGFAVTRVTKKIVSQYPNIASGYVPEGEPTCASSADTCFDFPVQQKNDGMPLASFDSWISGAYEGNEAFDIWFSPTESRHSYATNAGDTELMIWTAWPGLSGFRGDLSDYTTIDGMRFGIMSWESGGPHRFVAYLWLNAPTTAPGHKLDISGLWLNPFFRNAESHGWLSPSDWLWSIDLGFEMKSGGVLNNIHDYSLQFVN